ncbi:MAG: tripartite tricarboxylate transporter permease [Burkholderiaceae bacterium]|nr:tripartite tricarboxylate transporter permease [Sulfuritalea sp.]MCF8175408.1 tripartite tricarboxylate transporter permease [Burkholderiaceae bacterium]
MDVFINLFHGMLTALEPFNFGIMLTGLAVGVIAGALPGISFVNAMAMALPFTYLMTPLSAMVFLGGIYAGGVFGGSISAILINIPGTPASLPTCWDGFPMTRRGESARALSLAIAASATGGLISALLLTFGAPPFAKLALAFDQPEFFSATFLGLVSIIAIAKSAPWISMVSLFCGIVIGSVGVDPLYGLPRLTFGIPALQNGINFVVVMIGLFALGEVLEMLGQSSHGKDAVASAKLKLPSFSDLWSLKGPALRGTGIGCMIGMIPGAGATVGAVIAYGVEKQVSPRGAEFGTGVEAGLMAPEAAKNATTGAAMIPLLTLGIPGSAATAIMLAALVLHGVTPGPLLFATQSDMVYTIFASLLLANLCMIGAGAAVARGFSLLMKVPPTVLGAFIVILSVVGAFGVRNNIADVYICLSFGVLGYAMNRFAFPSAPLVLGVILGPLAERYFMTSLANYDNDLTIFFTRPISATILALASLFVLWALTPDIKGKVMRLLARRKLA